MGPVAVPHVAMWKKKKKFLLSEVYHAQRYSPVVPTLKKKVHKKAFLFLGEIFSSDSLEELFQLWDSVILLCVLQNMS